MGKKKQTELMEVRIFGPGCNLDNRLYLPGETALVPVEVAQEWINSQRAIAIIAEVQEDDAR